jgi:hypothetical protein
MYWAIRAIIQVILLNAHTLFIPQSQAQIKSRMHHGCIITLVSPIGSIIYA